MDSKHVIFGKWDNHGNNRNLRITSQNSQRVDGDVELVFKHGNKHVADIKDVGKLKDVIKFTSMRPVEGFNLEKAYQAIELFNEYHRTEMDPEKAIEGWNLKKEIQK